MGMAMLKKEFSKLDKLVEALEHEDKSRKTIFSFMENTSAICFVKDSEGKYEFVNPEFLSAMRMKTEEVIGKTDWDLFPPETALTLTGHDIQTLRSRQSIVVIESIPTEYGRKNYLVTKFIVTNGGIGVGGLALELPDHLLRTAAADEKERSGGNE